MEAIPPPYPLLSGTWFFSAYEPGKGPLVGEVEIEKSGQDYVTSAKIRTPNGSIEERQGRAVLYTGYSWRGSSSGSHLGDMKEVLMLADDGSRLTGRFFKGVYGELGIDVELSRIGKDARVTAVWPRGLRADVGDTSLTILGANLPINLAPGDVVLGHGLEVQEITSTTSNALEVRVAVSGDVPVGSRDVSLGDAVLVDAFAVYDQMDYVKVEPEEGMARLGGVQIPKQFVQFEAVGYHDGPDDERFTEDDINLGLVNATWHLEEYIIREDDDDLKYVGAIDDNGFFTPNIEGPNPDRKGTNNFGDVWAVAVFDQSGQSGQSGQSVSSSADSTLRGRAHLLVTVPTLRLLEQLPMNLVYGSEMHRFQSGERHFAFLVPSSMVLELDPESRGILDKLGDGPQPIDKLASTRRCCTARSKSLTSLCRLQSHPAQYVSGIPSAAILLSISHPIRCSTRCLANVRARISGPMIAL